MACDTFVASVLRELQIEIVFSKGHDLNAGIAELASEFGTQSRRRLFCKLE